MEKEKNKLLQWHPAFYTGIQVEFEKERDKLIFENEHTLSKKPMLIDVLIIKKNTKEILKKNLTYKFVCNSSLPFFTKSCACFIIKIYYK